VVTATGTLTNQGTITAVGDATLTANKITNDTTGTVAAGANLTAAAAEAVNNNGRMDGNVVKADSKAVTNTGTVTAGTLTVNADTITNAGDAAMLASTGDTTLNAKNAVENKDGATIYSMGNITIAGSDRRDADGQPVDKANSVLNQSATIQAEKDITIHAKDITNKKRVFAVGQTVTSDVTYSNIIYNLYYPTMTMGEDEPIGDTIQIGINPNSAVLVGYERTDNFLANYYGHVDFQTLFGPMYIFATWMIGQNVKETTFTQDSPEGKISSGKNIYLRANTINNNTSSIIAANTLDAIGTVNNTSQGRVREITRHLVDTDRAYYTYDYVTYSGYRVYDVTTYEQLPGYTSIFSGGQQVNITGPNVSNITKNPENVTGGNSSTLIPLKQTAPATNVLSSNTLTTIPSNKLYTIHTEPGSKYLIETDPRFANYGTFITSDYMLDQLHVEPDKTMKQIGDGFYQQKLIRDQIAELTGRQFLDPNSSTQEEYKALMDNGVAYANKFNLQVGVALTAEQMAQLTSNMVWMVEQEVQGQKVLVPVVYLAPNQNSSLQDSGAIIAGKDVKITVDQDIVNQNGKITGENINLVAGRDIKNETTTYVAQTGNKSIDLTFDYDHSKTGNDLRTIAGQTAEISATGNVTVNAGRDVNIAGGKVSSDKDIAIDAGRNLNVSSVVTGDTTTAKDYLKDSTVNVTSGINAKGNIAMTSQQDANLSGAQVSAGQDLTLKSVDGNVNISAVKDEEILDVKTGTSRNWKRTRTDDETVIGSNLQAGGNVNITAKSDSNVPNPNGGNITVAGSNIYSDTGKITLDADKNVTVQEVTEKHESLVQTHKKKSGFLSSKTTDTLDYSLVNEVQGSTISGDSVSINSGKDLTVKASNVVATNDVNLTAANDANIIAAQETGKDEHYSRTKKSGLFSGGGLGFTIGSQTQTTTLNEQVKDEIGSTVGSVAGNVNITAGNNVKSEGALITSGQDTNITGKNVTIDNTTNIYDSQYKYEFKQSGLTVSLGGGAVDAGMNVAGDINRAGDVKDDRLAALYDYKAVQDIKTLGKELKASDGFSVNVSIGSSKTTIEQNTHVETVNTSNITAGGDVTIKGTDGDVNLKATNINANDVTLEAAKNLNIGSDKNVTQIDNKTSSSSSSIGASIGLTTGALNAIGGVSTSKGTENQAATTHTESVITASGTATLKSGDDTNIIGSQVKGEKVVADIGGNLNIESQQDSETFNSKNKSTGIGLDTSKSSVANGSNNTTQINSNFESVVEQAGIYAGKGGFEIDVEKNTDLKAGVISSKAEAVKNALRTGSLTFSNMENKAKYNASSKGNNYSLGKDGKFTGSPTPSMPANGSADNTTEAAISPGTIEVRNDPNQDLSNLSRNPEAALNALGKIFDKKTVQEQQELANVFGQVAFKAIGDLAENMRKNAKTDQEKAKWAEGGEYKVLLHAVAGGLMSQLAGNGFSSGAAGAGLSQALQGQLANITDPGVRLLISSLFGEIAAEIVHGDAQAGASAAYAGTKYNDLTHRPTTKGSVLYAKSEEDGLYHFYVVDSNGGEVELKGSPKAGQVYWDERDSYERVQLADGSNSYFTWKYVDGIRVAADDYGNAIIVNGNPVINPSDLASSPILGYYVQSQYASAYSNARMFSLLNVDANASSNLNLVAAEVEKQREMEKEIQDSVLSSIGGGSKFQKLSQSSISHLGKHTASEFVQQVPYLSDEALSRILAKNSFFNPSWSKEQIIAATEEAYNALRSKGLTGLQSYIVNGETIKVFIKPDGTYDSAYGVYKLTMEFFGR
jgi:filamentous hemagglutinin